MSRARILGGSAAAAAALVAPMGAYYEGVSPTGYADPVGIPTDCIGETEGARVGVQRFSLKECIARYPVRLQRVWNEGLARCIHSDVTIFEAGALMSFADNTGIAKTCASTMVRMLNAGAPPAEWCAQMSRWNKSTLLGVKIELPGLNRRRAGERAMCNGDAEGWKRT